MTRAARPVLLLAGLVAAGLVLRALSGGSAQLWLHRAVVGHGAAGPLLFVAAGALLCAIGVPRQVVAFTAGGAFGLWAGAGLAMAAQLLGCLADFLWARLLARDWAVRRLGGRLRRVDRFLVAHPFAATLMMRLLPVGSNLLLNLLAGVSGVAAAPFLTASALGYLPQTLVFALAATGVGVGGPVRVLLGAALLAASFGLGLLLVRRTGRGVADDTTDAPAL